MEMLGRSEAVRTAILNHISINSVTAKHYSAGDLLRMKGGQPWQPRNKDIDGLILTLTRRGVHGPLE